MKQKWLLRTAAILMLLHSLGHTLGTFSWKKTTDPVKKELISQMTAHAFPIMGKSRSMTDAMDGYGLVVILALLLITAILWICSGEAVTDQQLKKKIIALTAVTLLCWGIIELVYFFPLAAGLTLIAMLFTSISFFSSEKLDK